VRAICRPHSSLLDAGQVTGPHYAPDLLLHQTTTPGTYFPGEMEGATGTLLATYDFAEQQDPSTQTGQVTLNWDSTQRSDGSHTLTLRTVETYDDGWGGEAEADREAHHFDIDIDNTSQDLAPPPVYLEVSNVTDTQVTLSWTPTTISDFDKYEVHKGTTANFTPGAGTLVGSVNDSRCTVHGLGPLQPSTDYYLKIKLYDDGANTSVSNEVHVTTLSTAGLFTDPAAGTNFLLGRTVYDAAGQVTARYDANGNGTFYTYDAVGNRTSVTDANGNTTSFAYSSRSWRTSETDAEAGVTARQHDNEGNVASVTDPEGSVWSFSYDYAGRQRSVQYPDETIENRAYDGNGNLIALKKPDGTIVRYFYDALNHRTEVEYATCTDVEFTYDALGRLTQVVDAAGTTTYQYDDLGRVLSVTQPCGNTTKTIQYAYDTAGNRSSLTDPESGIQTYQRDATDVLTSTSSPYAGTTTLQRDAVGRSVRQDNGNGTSTLRTFDAAGRLTGLEYRESNDALIASFAYTHDAVGNVDQVVESCLATDNTTYAFDALNRLTVEKRTGAHPYWYEYVYDAASNRVQMIVKDEQGNVLGTKEFTYNDDYSLLTADNTTYAHDANANVTSKTTGQVTQTHSWSCADTMTGLHDGVEVSYGHDAFGLRRWKQVTGQGATWFVYDLANADATAETPLVGEYDANGNLIARYEHAEELIALRRGDLTASYALDARGNTVSLTDSTEQVIDRYLFDTYGEPVAQSGTTTNPFRFDGASGSHTDSEAGLIWGEGAYEPGTGLGLSEKAWPQSPPGAQGWGSGGGHLGRGWGTGLGDVMADAGQLLRKPRDLWDSLKSDGRPGSPLDDVDVSQYIHMTRREAQRYQLDRWLDSPDGRRAQRQMTNDALNDALSFGPSSLAVRGPQLHHAITRRISDQLGDMGLQRHFRYRDPRYTSRARDYDAHHGYQQWHIDLDDRVVDWLQGHLDAARDHADDLADRFIDWLRDVYDQPDLQRRFPQNPCRR